MHVKHWQKGRAGEGVREGKIDEKEPSSWPDSQECGL